MTRETSESFRRGLWALVALPAVLSAWMVAHFGVDVPFWDEWTIATLLQRIDDGTLTLAALFAQHNEHRMLVPRIVQLLAALTGTWDTRVGMWLTQGLVLGMTVGCVVLWRPTTQPRHRSWMLLSLALVSLILFSPAQHQNLFWGFQFSFYIPAACLLAGTIVAAAPGIGVGTALTVIAILSTVATFSLFPGLVTWPLGAAAVLLLRGRPRRDDWWKWGGWAACCGGGHPRIFPELRAASCRSFSLVGVGRPSHIGRRRGSMHRRFHWSRGSACSARYRDGRRDRGHVPLIGSHSVASPR